MKSIFCLIVLIGLGIAGYRYIGEKKTGDPKTAQKMRQEKESASKESKKKESPKLEFLGISVNESEENIKAHLLNRGFKFPGSQQEFLEGRFWLLKEPSIAEIKFDSGKIIITFIHDPTAQKLARKNLGNLDTITRNEAINQVNELTKFGNIVIRRYFDTLQRKYGKAQLEDKNIIVLTDGLIEYKPPFTVMEIVFSSKVVFYNRKAAEKRLQEIKAKNDELSRQYNDI